MPEAARLTDPIAHTSALAGFLVGAVIGVALIATVAFATVTCGFGVALVAGLAAGIGASAILSLGEAIGKMFSSVSGTISTGSPNVFTNAKAAAMAVASTVVCSKHPPVPAVAEGSATVFINSLPAARKKDAIVCGAKIDEGSPNVFIGGGTVQCLPVEDEIPGWLRTTVDVAFTLAGLVGGLAGWARQTGLGFTRAFTPCAAKFVAGFVIGEAVGRFVIAPVLGRVIGGLFGNPVDVTTGHKILLAHEETDFVVASPIPVEINRFYASNLISIGSLGRGWVLPWEVRLQARDGHIWYTDPQGREIGFPIVEPGHCAFHDAEQVYLACTRDGRHVVYNLNEMYFEFDKLDLGSSQYARLRRVEDQAGQWQVYEYDDEGQVSSISTIGSVRLRLFYDPTLGRLTSIVSIVGECALPLVNYTYNKEGELIAVTDANGQIVRQFRYLDGLMVSHTSALGFESQYEWKGIAGEFRVVRCSNSEGENATFTYDIINRQTTVQDELGRIARWTYDEQHQVVHCVDLDGSEYGIEYTPAGLPATLHLPGERTVAISYDAAGRIVTEKDPLGRTTTTRYHGNGLRVSEVILPDGARWRAEYDLQGRLLSTLDPLGRLERYEYVANLSALPHTYINARGGGTTMQWNVRGQLTTYTDCSGKVTSYEYDVHGQLSATVNALGQRVQFTRRPTGELIFVELPDGSQEELRYDAAGLIIKKSNKGAQTTQRWERNARGQVVEATDASDRNLRYRYDAQGRLVELASDNGSNYRFSYDHGDRLVYELRPDGMERYLSYDQSAHLWSLETVGILESQEKHVAVERPRRIQSFGRDALGRLVMHMTSTAITSYSWDGGDRLREAERIPTEAGLVLGIKRNTVTFNYDKAGRLMAEHGENGTVRYELDELDQLATMHLPHDQRFDMLTYGCGHVHQIRSGDGVISDFDRDDLHREVQRTQGSLTQLVGYDSIGRRTWQAAGRSHERLGPGQGRFWHSYRYNLDGELAEMRGNLYGTVEYQYDAAGRLLQQTRAPDQSIEAFAWDAAGNLLDGIQRKSQGSIQDNRLRVWQNLRFDYDPWGNLKIKRKGPHQTQRFSFDAEDRLISVQTETQSGTIQAHFDYDALGRRIGKSEIHVEVDNAIPYVEHKRFVWQGLRLAQEICDTGVSSYVYNPEAAYSPLARVDAPKAETMADATIANSKTAAQRARTYHFHTDLVGAPLEVTDEAGELAWTGKYQAWGKVHLGEGQVLLPKIEQPIRYAGQYADESTGLHYNTFRYYDPDIGRFISQDPIGLAGGENLYFYVPNPAGWVDPLGLSPSQQLAGAMNSAGRPVPSGYAAHHLIPTSVAGRSNLIQEATRRGIYNPNGASNGVALPTTAAESLRTGKPLHSGGHLASYYEAAQSRLLLAENRIGDLAKVSDRELLRRIGAVERSMRMGLNADRLRLQSTDPRPRGTRSAC